MILLMVNFPTRIPDYDSHRPALLYFFLSSDASICSTISFPPSENSDHVVSVSIDFPVKSKQDTLSHRIAYDCYRADWDGLRDHLRNIPSEDTFKLSASTAASDFCEWVQVEVDVCIPLIVSIRSNLTHFHGFQELALLSYLIEIIFFVCTNRINLLNLKSLRTFGELLIVFSTKITLLYLLCSTDQKCCCLHLIKQSYLLKTFLRTLVLKTLVSHYLFSLLELIWNCAVFP